MDQVKSAQEYMEKRLETYREADSYPLTCAYIRTIEAESIIKAFHTLADLCLGGGRPFPLCKDGVRISSSGEVLRGPTEGAPSNTRGAVEITCGVMHGIMESHRDIGEALWTPTVPLSRRTFSSSLIVSYFDEGIPESVDDVHMFLSMLKTSDREKVRENERLMARMLWQFSEDDRKRGSGEG